MASVSYDDYLVIGIAGHARSGKDTAAQYIQKLNQKHDFASRVIVKSFAEPLKVVVTSVMRDLVPNDISVSAYAYLETLKNNNQELNGINIRKALQQVSDVFRNMNDNIFVEILIAKIKNILANHVLAGGKTVFIIPDTRFKVEEDLLRKEFGDKYVLIKVGRPEIDEKAARGEPPYDHVSEKQIDMLTPDVSIMNDGSLEGLEAKIEKTTLKIIKLKT